MFCGYHRWAVSRQLDEGRPIGKRTEAHLRRCASCQRFHEAALELDRALTGRPATLAQAGRIPVSTPIAAAPNQTRPTGVRRGARRPRPAALAAAAALLISVTGWWGLWGWPASGPGTGVAPQHQSNPSTRTAQGPEGTAKPVEDSPVEMLTAERFSPAELPAMVEARFESEARLLWRDMRQMAASLVGDRFVMPPRPEKSRE